MITGFEKQTHELTDVERLRILPAMINGLKTKIGKINAITSTKAMRMMKSKGYKISGARWRKIINHIRVNGLIENLIGTSKGYYIATTHYECRMYIQSLDERINAITTVRDSLVYQANKTF